MQFGDQFGGVEPVGVKLLLNGEQPPAQIGDFNVSCIELYEILREWLAEREVQ